MAYQLNFLDDDDIVIASPKNKKEEKKETKQVESKKDSQKDSKKDNKKDGKKKPEEELSVPVTVRCGYVNDVSLGADCFGGREKVVMDDVLTAITKQFLWLGKPDNLKGYKAEDGVVIVAVNTDGALSATKKITITPETRIYCVDRDKTEALEDLTGEVEVKELTYRILPKSTVGVQLVPIKETNSFIAVPGLQQVYSNLKLPIVIHSFTDSEKNIVISADDVKKFREATLTEAEKQNNAEADAEDDDDDDIVTKAVNKALDGTDTIADISVEEAEKVLSWKCKTLAGCGKIYCSKKGKEETLYTFRVVVKPKAQEYGKPKVETYNIGESGALVRFLCYDSDANFRITPADFEGKLELTADDIWPVIKARYSEFDGSTGVIVSFIENGTFGNVLNIDKKNGSRKG